MNIPVQARKDLKFLVSLIRGLAAFDEALDQAGSLDKLIAASEERIAALKAEEEGIQGKLDKAQKDADAIVAEAGKLAQAAQNKQAQAEAAIEDARKQAAGIVAEAQAIKVKAESSADAIKSGQNVEINTLAAAITKAKGNLAALQADVAAAGQNKSGMLAEIESLKQKFMGA